MRKWLLGVVVVLVLTLAPACASAQSIGVALTTQTQLTFINPDFSINRQLFIDRNVTDLAFSTSNTTLYAIDLYSGFGTGRNLCSINTATGHVTIVASLKYNGASIDIPGLDLVGFSVDPSNPGLFFVALRSLGDNPIFYLYACGLDGNLAGAGPIFGAAPIPIDGSWAASVDPYVHTYLYGLSTSGFYATTTAGGYAPLSAASDVAFASFDWHQGILYAVGASRTQNNGHVWYVDGSNNLVDLGMVPYLAYSFTFTSR